MTRGQPLPGPRASTLVASLVSLLLAMAGAAGPALGAVAKLADEPENGGKPEAAAPIVLLYTERPPYNSRTPDGKLSGIVGTPVTQAFAKAGLRFELHEASLQRQLEALKRNTPRVCVSGLYKTAEREQFARYTKPVSQDQAMVGLANAAFTPANGTANGAGNGNGTPTQTVHALLDHPEVTVLLRNAVNYGPFLEGQFATMKARRATTDGQFAQVVKMIYAGRAQLTFFPLEEAQYYAKVAGYSPQQFKVLTFGDMPAGEKRYILCSRQVDGAVVEKLNAGLPGS